MGINSSSLILVAVINNTRDLEIAKILGWYRIPLRTAPKVIAVDYLAFYQTAAFGEEKWRIRYTAPVRGYELTTRIELLKEEPSHPSANHEYYKIQIGPIEKLDLPIMASKWRRITFFYTTGEYLLSAQSIEDLVVRSNERQTLWRELRERMDQTNLGTSTEESYSSELPSDVLSLFFGIRESDQLED